MEKNILEIRNLVEQVKKTNQSYIDASVGVMKDNSHKLITFKIIEELLKDNINFKTLNYSSILGSKDFNNIFCDYLFKTNIISYYSSGFVMGATAALNFAFKEYCYNKKILISSLRWSNYDLIAKQNKIQIIEYTTLNSKGTFNIEEIKRIIESDNEDYSLLINDPCLNPIGYTISIKEWEKLLKIIQEFTKRKKITLILDLAYLDFTSSNYKNVFTLIDNCINNNFKIIMCYSFSKSFSIYGYRGGMCIGMFNSNKEKEEFDYKLKEYIRATWSSSNNLLTTTIFKLLKNKFYQKIIFYKQNKIKKILKDRRKYFMGICDKYNIDYFPFYEGFFVFIKVINVNELVEYLIKKNIFVIPYKEGIRIAISSINHKDILLILKEINNYFQSYKI